MDSKQEMDFAIEWAEKLVQEITPDEIDQVPFVVEGFMKDEKARKKLLQQSKGNALGGFGVDGSVLLPCILQALSVATPFLGGLLASRTFASFLVITKEIKELLVARSQRPQERVKFEITDPMAQQCLVSLAQTLRGAGLAAEKSETLAYEVLAFLLQDPTNAVLFLQKLTERR